MKKKVLHVKPTAEELEVKAQEAIKEADRLKDKPVVPKSPITPAPEPKIKPEPKEEEPPIPEPKPSPDYKEKFIQSTKEAQILASKNKKMNEAFDKASDIAEPTEEEMTVEFPDWEDMNDFEKKIAKQSVTSERRFSAIAEVGKDFKDIEAWQSKVNAFLTDPKTDKQHPGLVGKEAEFKLFVSKPTRMGVDFEDLVASFLWSNKSARPSNKGKMFEQGTGGPSTKPDLKPKVDKISVEEARTLRLSDYKKYKEYLNAGRIDTESI